MVQPDPFHADIHTSNSYAFGEFRLDVIRRMLFCGPEAIPLPERTFQILLLLVQAAGKVVEKETIAAHVWPDASSVSDGNLSQHIYMLRQILGVRARDHSYIITMPGVGWRFGAPVAMAFSASDYVTAENALLFGDALLGGGFQVFQHYCKGSQLLERRTAPCLRAAIESFDAALHRDSNYAPALIGRARSYALLAEFWHVPGSQAFPIARRDLEHALRLDSGSAIAHAVLSGILLFADWDWKGAREELNIAVRRNPGSTFVRNNAAWLYICEGSYSKAIGEVQHALVMEPSSFHLLLLFARALIHAGDYSQAISCLSNLVDADPDFYIARRYRAQALLLSGQPETAIADLLLLPQERSEEPSFRLPMIGRAYADCGDMQRAREIHSMLLSMANTDYVVCWNLAISAIGIGEHDEALTHLEKALAERESSLLFLKSLPWFRPIEKAPRFESILRQVGPEL